MLGSNCFSKVIALLLFEVWMCALVAGAQTVSEYPTGHFSIYQNQLLGNPAPVLGENVGQLSVLYQGRTGPFSDVNAMHFSGSLRIKNKHLAGVYVLSENESEILRKARYYGQYALKANLSSSAYLVFGVMAGAVSYQFNASNGNTGGSDTKPDASVGLSFIRNNLSIGLNMQQAPQVQLQPLIYQYQLRRYYVAMARFKQEIDERFQVIYLAETRLFSDRKWIGRASVATEIHQKLLFGTQFDNWGTATMYGGIRFDIHQQTELNAQFNYVMQNLYRKSGYRLNIYEVSFGINF
jgi:hypothetical protein